MLGRIGRLGGSLLAALLTALLVPAAASADSVKIGSTLQNNETGDFLSYAAVQLSSVTAGQLTSPSDGVITTWGIRTGLSERYSILVLHPAGSGFNVTAGAASPGPTDGTPEKIYSYPAASLHIAKGDTIGLLATDLDVPYHHTGNAGDVLGGNSTSPPTVGGSFGPTGPNPSSELLLQATVKFCKAPDVAGMKIGAAEQLITAADCTPVVRKKKTRKKKKVKRVVRQTTAAGTTGVPGTSVEIVVAKSKK